MTEHNGIRRILPPPATSRQGTNPCWAVARAHAGDWVRTDLAQSAISEHRRRRRDEGYTLSIRDGVVWVRWTSPNPVTPS